MTFTAHQYWDERIISAFASRRNIYREKAIGGESETGVAVVKLVNTDGGLDGWEDLYAIDGRDAVLWMGTDVSGVTFADLLEDPSLERNYLAQLTAYVKADGSTTTLLLSSQGYSPSVTEAPAGYGEVFRGVSAAIPLPGLEVADLILKDKQAKLDESPHRPTYPGGIDGLKMGTDGRASVATSTEADLTGGMVAMIWIRPDSLAVRHVYGWGASAPAQYPWLLQHDASGSLRFRYTYGGGSVGTIVTSAASMVTAENWYCCGFRISGDQLYFFSQDLEDRTSATTWDGPYTLLASTRDAESGASFQIGHSSSSFQGYWNQARFWDDDGGDDYRRHIEQRMWIDDISASDSFAGASLEGYYKGDEGTGTNVADSAPGGNDLTLAGTYTWNYPLRGGVDIAGKEMPLVFGKFLHVEPVLVDAANLIYQVHPRSIASITEVLQNGGTIALDATFGSSGDATSLANFLADSVVNGKYGTYLAGGYLKLASDLNGGGLRVSGTGDNVGGYVSTAADIIERMTIDFGPLVAADINSTSFTAFNTTTGSAVNGLAIPAGDQTHLSKHVDFLLQGGRGWWIFARDDGEMELGQFTDPKTDVSTPKEIHDWHYAYGGITPLSLAPPSKRQKLGYARTWDTIGQDIITGTIADSRLDELSQPYRWVTPYESSIAAMHLTAEEAKEFGTTLADRDDAFSEAVARQHLYGTTGRRMFEIRMKTAPDTFELGDLVKMFHDDRYSWSAGVLFRVVQVDEGSMMIRIWG